MANKIVNFLREVKTELGKVSWSTKEELFVSTIVVLISVALLAIFIGICDFIFLKTINFIISS
jgi:preprotein translocase subunit SecE